MTRGNSERGAGRPTGEPGEKGRQGHEGKKRWRKMAIT